MSRAIHWVNARKFSTTAAGRPLIIADALINDDTGQELIRTNTHGAGIILDAAAADRIVAALNRSVHWTSKDQNHLTPAPVLEALARMWPDGIDLDPCAEGTEHPDAMAANGHEWNVPAHAHENITTDGLKVGWASYGRVHVFCNPPYKGIERWIDKAIAWAANNVVTVLLLPDRPGSRWHRKLDNYFICRVKGRLRFKGADGAAPFPSALAFIASPDCDETRRFFDAFGPLGSIHPPVDGITPLQFKAAFAPYGLQQGANDGLLYETTLTTAVRY